MGTMTYWTRRQARKGEVRPSSANKRVEVELLPRPGLCRASRPFGAGHHWRSRSNSAQDGADNAASSQASASGRGRGVMGRVQTNLIGAVLSGAVIAYSTDALAEKVTTGAKLFVGTAVQGSPTAKTAPTKRTHSGVAHGAWSAIPSP
jgi:hypothetical protein